MSERRGFSKPIAECIAPTLKPVLKKHGLAESRILTDWQQIAGEHYASRSVPEKLSFPHGETTGGTLTLRVANGFALEIQHQAPLLLEKIATYFGHAAVKRIQIVQAPMNPPKPKRAASPVSLNETQQRQLRALIEKAPDDELKESLASLGAAILAK